MTQSLIGLASETPSCDNILPLLADADGFDFIRCLVALKRHFDPDMGMSVLVHDFGIDMRRFILVTPFVNGNLYWDARGAFYSPASMYGWPSLGLVRSEQFDVRQGWEARICGAFSLPYSCVGAHSEGFAYRRAQQLSAPSMSPVDQGGAAHKSFLSYCQSIRHVGVGEILSADESLMRIKRAQRGLNSFVSLVRSQNIQKAA